MALTVLAGAASVAPVWAEEATPAEPIATYEAESAAAFNGVGVESRFPGFSGSGYVAQFDGEGDFVRFDISVPRQDYYTLRFRFLNGEGTPAIRKLMLDGVEVPGTLRFRNLYDFRSFGSGGEWHTLDESLRLSQGQHRVALVYQEGDGQGSVLIDRLEVLDETRPSSTSTRSLLMNNWTDLVGIHQSARSDQADESALLPRLSALHWSGDWPTNQIDGAAAYFRDATAGKAYTEAERFDTDLYFDADGIMHVDYLNYGEEALPVSISKEYAMVPNEPILLARYTLSNRSGMARTIDLMELVDVNAATAGTPSEDAGNGSSGGGGGSAGDGSGSAGDGNGSGAGEDPESSGGPIRAFWYAQYNAWIVDLGRSDGGFLVFGAFDFQGQRAAGIPAEGRALGEGSGLLTAFETQGELTNNSGMTADDMILALADSLTIGVGGTRQITFFYSVRGTFSEAFDLIERIVLGKAPADWFAQTRSAWQEWLASGRSSVETDDPGVNETYTRNLIVLRHSQQPEYGSFVASTNPSYSYKVWPRDSTVAALSLAAAGYYEQAERFWTWMAEVQEEGTQSVAGEQDFDEFPLGTWYTNYSYWHRDQPIDFVQPEWDSVGQFLIGVYHHWRLLNESDTEDARRFLGKLYPAVTSSAQWIADNVQPEQGGEYGFGPPGYSVWEEDFEYNTYTQVSYASGLNAARLLAEQMGHADLAAQWLADAVVIRDNLVQPVESQPCGGMWDAQRQYFIRGLFPPQDDSGECEPNMLLDGSSNLMWVFGLIPPDDPKASAHRATVLDRLTPPYDLGSEPACIDPEELTTDGDFGLGISRYEGDTFYHTSEFNPGGQCESKVPMASWPWMSSYMSMAEHWLGEDELAFARLQWYVSVTGVGYTATGEGVDWSTQEPIPSTMSQPDDGGYNMQIALLNYLNLFDPRLPPLESSD